MQTPRVLVDFQTQYTYCHRGLCQVRWSWLCFHLSPEQHHSPKRTWRWKMNFEKFTPNTRLNILFKVQMEMVHLLHAQEVCSNSCKHWAWSVVRCGKGNGESSEWDVVGGIQAESCIESPDSRWLSKICEISMEGRCFHSQSRTEELVQIRCAYWFRLDIFTAICTVKTQPTLKYYAAKRVVPLSAYRST